MHLRIPQNPSASPLPASFDNLRIEYFLFELLVLAPLADPQAEQTVEQAPEQLFAEPFLRGLFPLHIFTIEY